MPSNPAGVPPSNRGDGDDIPPRLPVGAMPALDRDGWLDDLSERFHADLIALGPLPPGWRPALTDSAHRIHALVHRAPMFLEVLLARPRFGPMAIQWNELILAAMSNGEETADFPALLFARAVVDAWLTGALINERRDREFEQWLIRDHGTDPLAGLTAALARGDAPMLARALETGDNESGITDDEFARALARVLAGVGPRANQG